MIRLVIKFNFMDKIVLNETLSYPVVEICHVFRGSGKFSPGLLCLGHLVQVAETLIGLDHQPTDDFFARCDAAVYQLAVSSHSDGRVSELLVVPVLPLDVLEVVLVGLSVLNHGFCALIFGHVR